MNALPSASPPEPLPEPLPELSLPEWLVLTILSQRPAHGFAVAQLTAAGGDLGRVWQIPKAVVYRALGRLLEGGLIVPEGTEPGQGPQRTVYTAAAAGREAAGRWLRAPVEHVRDIRSVLLMKLALLDRAGEDPSGLMDAQREVLVPLVAAIETRRAHSEGFDSVILAWRRSTAVAALDFLDMIAPGASRPRLRRIRHPHGHGEEAVGRVVIAGPLPAAGRGVAAQRLLGQRLVAGDGVPVPGGQCDPAGRVEQHEQPAGPGHPGQLPQSGRGVRQVVDQAGREDRVGRAVGEGQRAGVGEHQRRASHGGGGPGRVQHLRRHVQGDDRA
jgi:DNA-binding PadR family transcriptional regulator